MWNNELGVVVSPSQLENVKNSGVLNLLGKQSVPFDMAHNIRFHQEFLPRHRCVHFAIAYVGSAVGTGDNQ